MGRLLSLWNAVALRVSHLKPGQFTKNIPPPDPLGEPWAAVFAFPESRNCPHLWPPLHPLSCHSPPPSSTALALCWNKQQNVEPGSPWPPPLWDLSPGVLSASAVLQVIPMPRGFSACFYPVSIVVLGRRMADTVTTLLCPETEFPFCVLPAASCRYFYAFEGHAHRVAVRVGILDWQQGRKPALGLKWSGEGPCLCCFQMHDREWVTESAEASVFSSAKWVWWYLCRVSHRLCVRMSHRECSREYFEKTDMTFSSLSKMWWVLNSEWNQDENLSLCGVPHSWEIFTNICKGRVCAPDILPQGLIFQKTLKTLSQWAESCKQR